MPRRRSASTTPPWPRWPPPPSRPAAPPPSSRRAAWPASTAWLASPPVASAHHRTCQLSDVGDVAELQKHRAHRGGLGSVSGDGPARSATPRQRGRASGTSTSAASTAAPAASWRPDLFGVTRDQSIVVRQPTTDPGDQTDAWLAAQACPTQSIGTASHQRRPGRLFPREIADGAGVFDCGYCSPDSFGATSWFVHRPGANVLVDSPRFTAGAGRAASRDLGGIDHIAAHPPRRRRRRRAVGRPSSAPGCGSTPTTAARPRSPPTCSTGSDEVEIAPGLRRRPHARPHPGQRGVPARRPLPVHRRLAGLEPRARRPDRLPRRLLVLVVGADRVAAPAWPTRHRFAWVLPGHGARGRGDPDDLHRRLVGLVDRMARYPLTRPARQATERGDGDAWERRP